MPRFSVVWRVRTRAGCGTYKPTFRVPTHHQTPTRTAPLTHRGEGRLPHKQLVRQYPNRPAVHLVGVAGVGAVLVVLGVLLNGAVEDLGGEVVDSAQAAEPQGRS
jgi:hypothetical protein